MVCNIIPYLSNSSQFILRIEKKIKLILMKEEKYSIKGQTMLVSFILLKTFTFFILSKHGKYQILLPQKCKGQI